MKITRRQLRKLVEAISLDINVGDVVLTGKFKNKRQVVKKIGTDENGQPTHFIKDENNNLRCKLGYIFNDDDENPKCVLNKAAGWKCAIEARTEMENLKQKSIEELIGIAETTIADSDISILNKIKEKPNKYFVDINQKIVTLFEEEIDEVPAQEIQV